MRSPMTRNASAMVLVRASASVAPYAMTPGNSATSPSHRPSSSCSISILSIVHLHPLGPVAEPARIFGVRQACGLRRIIEAIFQHDPVLETGPGGALPGVGRGAGVEVVGVEFDLAGLAGGRTRRRGAGRREHAVRGRG